MRSTRSWLLVAGGLVLGLSIGGAMSIGTLIGRSARPDVAAPDFSELKLKAMASHGAETFAIATGPVDGQVEGLFTLDYLTGDLQCFVINPRTGKLGGWFKTNIAKHLPVESGKKPTYLIATGALSARGGNYSGVKPAGCICWVVDANSGVFAGYTFGWEEAKVSVGTPQAQEMVMVYAGKARNLEIRE